MSIRLMDKDGWLEMLVEKIRSTKNLDEKHLKESANVFRKHGSFDFADECYSKLGDNQGKLSLYVEVRL